MIRFFKNIVTSGVEDGYVSESFRQIIIVNLFCFASLFITFGFGVDALLRNKILFGIVLLSSFVLSVFLIFYLRKSRKFKIASIVLVSILFFCNIFLLVEIAETDTTAPFWHFLLPGTALFATNRKIGTFFIIALVIVTVALFEFAPWLQATYDAFYKGRFYIVFSSVIILSYVFEFIREKTFDAFEQANQKNAEFLAQVIQQKEEIETTSEMLTISNEELERKNRLVTNSISYAQRIQEAILPSQQTMHKYFPDSFIFYLPRDIVSGDFYWFSGTEDDCFIITADCTGHGVPGGFMSMIGHTLLNEIINNKKERRPSQILASLNEGVTKLLSNKSKYHADDGMDVTIARINNRKKELVIACANHYAFLCQDGILKKVEGSIYSIGGKFDRRPDVHYIDHTFELKQGTGLYMFSDGFMDQFGGPDDQKFMAGQFRKLIEDHHQLDMEKQYRLYENTFFVWKADQNQIDDVMLIGVRFS